MGINNVSAAFIPWLASYVAERNNGTFVKGRWVPGVASNVSFRGVVQNAEPYDLLVLEEGLRSSLSIKIHTVTELLPTIDDNNNGDIIPYLGDNYMVYNVAPRHIGNYHKAIAVIQDE